MSINNSLATKVTLAAVLLFFCGVGGLVFYSLGSLHNSMLEVYNHSVANTTSMLGSSLTAPVKFKQATAVEAVYKGLVSMPDSRIAALRVSDMTGETLAHYQSDRLIKVDLGATATGSAEKIGTLQVVRAEDYTLLVTDIMSSNGEQKLGELQVAWSLEALHDEIASNRNSLIMIGGFVLVAGGVVLMVLLNMAVSRPLRKMTSNMQIMAGGDYGIEIEGADRADEIGAMSRSLLVFRDNGRQMQSLRESQESSRAQAEAEKKAMMARLADTFEASVNGICQQLQSTVSNLADRSASMETAAYTSSTQSETANTTSQNASQNVVAVAAATEELSKSVNEISTQMQRTSAQISDVSAAAETANQQVSQLAEASVKINEIIDFIEGIAGQTNLLALNATIEAARAGEAGKGFAVVAGEVKNLASQTARATEDIKRQIEEIHSTTAAVVSTIRSIGQLVQETTAISAAVAAAVEEQGVATREIAHNTTSASNATGQVSHALQELGSLAGETSHLARDVTQAVAVLDQQARELNGEVVNFLGTIRSA